MFSSLIFNTAFKTISAAYSCDSESTLAKPELSEYFVVTPVSDSCSLNQTTATQFDSSIKEVCILNHISWHMMINSSKYTVNASIQLEININKAPEKQFTVQPFTSPTGNVIVDSIEHLIIFNYLNELPNIGLNHQLYAADTTWWILHYSCSFKITCRYSITKSTEYIRIDKNDQSRRLVINYQNKQQIESKLKNAAKDYIGTMFSNGIDKE
ncbi:hypothetical protein ECANGB1_671 [Enterospora canceri]|uniref:Uncharacterized protein n=1 Tax=Enterospora canceri TaxID=1081671 RepID=A0A1Y1S7T8_9MICR|nr:hypothetical protein ECANGB1_671 [Enterospora canceri]